MSVVGTQTLPSDATTCDGPACPLRAEWSLVPSVKRNAAGVLLTCNIHLPRAMRAVASGDEPGFREGRRGV